MSVCTPIAIGTPPQRIAPSSSAIITRIGIVEPEPAIFGRLVEAEKSEVAELLEQLMGGKLSRRLPFVDMRIDLAGDEFLQRAARLVVVGSEQHSVGFLP